MLRCALAVALAGCSQPPSDPAGTTGAEADAAASSDASRTVRQFPFTDVTAASGVDFDHENGAVGEHLYVETMAPGVALFDADGDEDLDLYVVDGRVLTSDGGETRGNRFFRNRGDGTFDDESATAGADDTGYGMGVTVGDWDGDGDADLYVLNYGPNALYENDGQGRFSRVEAGADDERWSVSGAFFDYDGDLDLDLYVANYLVYDVGSEEPCRAGTLEIYCSPEQYPPAADRLYRNDGGRFVDVSRTAGVETDGRGMGVAVGDVDLDGDADLYVTNDRSRNFLYLNQGGRLDEVGGESGVAYSLEGMAEGGMGAVIADLASPGRPAIFLTNFQKEPNRLYLPAGDGFFDDRSLSSGLGFPSREMVGWGIGTLDLEGDGDLDLVVGNGHVFENAEAFIPGSAYGLPDQLFLNQGDGTFQAQEFPGAPLSSRGIAVGDLDGDGDQDLVVASAGDRLRVWRNDAGRPERFLVLRLVGRAPNTAAYGAVVTAGAGDRRLRREVAAGGSYASHGDTRVTLGLGAAGRASAIEVRWPDGSVETIDDLDGGQLVVWGQGKGVLARTPLGH